MKATAIAAIVITAVAVGCTTTGTGYRRPLSPQQHAQVMEVLNSMNQRDAARAQAYQQSLHRWQPVPIPQLSARTTIIIPNTNPVGSGFTSPGTPIYQIRPAPAGGYNVYGR